MTRLGDIALPRGKRQWFTLLAPLFIISLYILIAAYKLRFPGTQYDEALYVNAALGGIDKTTFITSSFHGIPILLMPYIGALKAYLFFPIFAVFGVSAISMRLPNILLTAIGLFILYYLVREEAGRRLGLCILALTSLDASFIMFTRLDNGPVVIEFVLKVIGLLLLVRFVRNHKLWFLVGFWITMLLGVFNKLNFIWDINALTGAFVLIYSVDLWRKLKAQKLRQTVAICSVGYLLTVGYYLYISKAYHLGSSFGFVGWTTVKNNLIPVINGSWFYNYALSPTKIGISWIFWLMLAVIITGTLCLLRLLKDAKAFDARLVRFFVFTLTCLVLLLAQIIMTHQATAGWHYFSIYPLFGIVFILALNLLAQTVWQKRQWAITLSMGIAVSGLCLYQLNTYRSYVEAYNKPTSNIIWSTAIYSLADFAKSQTRATFISLDWGMQTQLIGFDPIQYKFYEVLGPIEVDNSTQNLYDFHTYIASKPNAYYITHAPGKAIFPETSKQFFKLAEEHGYEPQLVKTIRDSTQPIFELYTLRLKN